MADMSNSKYVGKWRISYVTVLGNTEPLTVENTLDLKADGTALQSSENGEDVKAYIWKETDYGVFLDGKSDMKLTADGDILKTKLFGFVTLNFERKQ